MVSDDPLLSRCNIELTYIQKVALSTREMRFFLLMSYIYNELLFVVRFYWFYPFQLWLFNSCGYMLLFIVILEKID